MNDKKPRVKIEDADKFKVDKRYSIAWIDPRGLYTYKNKEPKIIVKPSLYNRFKMLLWNILLTIEKIKQDKDNG